MSRSSGILRSVGIVGSTGMLFYGLGMGLGALLSRGNERKLETGYPFEYERLSNAVPFDAPALGITQTALFASIINELETSITECSLDKLQSAMKKADPVMTRQALSFINRHNSSLFSSYRKHSGSVFYEKDNESEFISALLDVCIKHKIDVFKINPSFIHKVARHAWRDKYNWEKSTTIIWSNVIRGKLLDLAIATASITQVLKNDILSEAVSFPYTSGYIAHSSEAKEEKSRAKAEAVKAKNIEVISKTLAQMNATHQEYYNVAMQNAIAQTFILTRTQTTAPPCDLTIFNLLCERVPEGIDLRKALVFALKHSFVYKVADIYVKKLDEVAKTKNVTPVTREELDTMIKLQNSSILPALANILRHHRVQLNYLFIETFKKDEWKGLANTRMLIGAPNEGVDFIRSKCKSRAEFISIFKEFILKSKTQDIVMLVAILKEAERDQLMQSFHDDSHSSDLRIGAVSEIFALKDFSIEVARCAEHLKTYATFQNIEPNKTFTEQATGIVSLIGWTKFLVDNLPQEEATRPKPR